MADQGMDYLPDWRDMAWPTCPECDGGAVVVDVSDGTVAWVCLGCGHRWQEEAKRQDDER